MIMMPKRTNKEEIYTGTSAQYVFSEFFNFKCYFGLKKGENVSLNQANPA